jgi:16S rRNA (cytosine967-C5)-methyltransferase
LKLPIAPARIAAFDILLRVEREQAYAVELLHSKLLDRLSPADRNLTTEIVMGVLRWRSLLDKMISLFSASPLRKLDLEVLASLRIGAYQLSFLARVPDHAVLNDSVELVKLAHKRSAAGMVNAILHKMAAQAQSGERIHAQGSFAETFAHPEWLVQHWIEQFGSQVVAQICPYDQQIPVTHVRLNDALDETALREQGIQLAPGALMTTARRVIAGDITHTTFFHSGRLAIQDEGSQVVAALVGDGGRILDCCAAPGGKTAALASRLPEAEIIAAELHPHRARLLRQMAPHANVSVVAADVLRLPFKTEFDCVLADVPCSGTGTLARNPEIKWRLRPEDISDLQSRQIGILRAAMRYVSPGGRLVYSTCSLEREENEQVVAACLDNNVDFHSAPMMRELMRLRDSGELAWNAAETLVSGDFLRTIPGVHPCDGFFAAVLQRY